MDETEERFWSKVQRTEGCWLWTAATTSNGYGKFHLGDRNEYVYAHRFSFSLTHGSIPEGAHILHSCDVPQCVRPEHLRAGTHSENMADMRDRGRARTNGFENKTHCPSGHAYDEENTYRDKRGKRSCRECARRRWREWDAKRKAGASA